MRKKGGYMAKILCPVLILVLSSNALAQEWTAHDPHSKGTGNSGVAISDGSSSSYWNPSNLGKGVTTFFSLKAPELKIGAFADLAIEGNTLETLDRISDLYKEGGAAAIPVSDIQTKLNAGTATAADLDPIFKIIENIAELDKDGNGAVGFGGLYAEIRLGNLAFSVRDTFYLGLDPVIDLSVGGNAPLAQAGVSQVLSTIGTGQTPSSSDGASLSSQLAGIPGVTQAQADQLAALAEQSGVNLSDPAVQSTINTVINATQAASGLITSGSTFLNNKSGVELKALELREIGASVGFELPMIMEKLRGGATLRLLEGTTFKKKVTFVDVEGGNDVFKDLQNDFDENSKTSTGATVDLGFGYPLIGDIVDVGLSVKNILPNEFDFDDGSGSIDLQPMARAGILVKPALGMNWLKLTADADITKNEFDGLDGYESQILGGGIQIDPNIPLFNLSIRGGAFTNIAADHREVIYTLGLSLKLIGFLQLDLAGQISADETKIEDSSSASGSKDLPTRAGAALALTLTF